MIRPAHRFHPASTVVGWTAPSRAEGRDLQLDQTAVVEAIRMKVASTVRTAT